MDTFLKMCKMRKSKGDLKGKKNRRAFMIVLYAVDFAYKRSVNMPKLSKYIN